MKYYVDFAAQSGFEYMLIDAGWSPRDDITKMNGKVGVPEVVQYARRKTSESGSGRIRTPSRTDGRSIRTV